MDRRSFIQKTIATASLVGLPSVPSAGNSGEEHEREFDEALETIKRLADGTFHPSVVRQTIASVNQIGEWGHCAMYISLFDPSTQRLAIECMVCDRENYHEYWPFFTDLDDHEDEQIKRLAPALLKRLEDFREDLSNNAINWRLLSERESAFPVGAGINLRRGFFDP